MSEQFLMQAQDDTTGDLYVWRYSSRDFAAAGYPGPNSAVSSTIAVRNILAGGQVSGVKQTMSIVSGSAALGERSGQAIEVHPQSGNSDDLESITGGVAGEKITLTTDVGDEITLLDNSDPNGGNLYLQGGENLVLADGKDRVHFEYDGTYWVEIGRSLRAKHNASATVSNLGNGSNTNYDIPINRDGVYAAAVRIVLKRETTEDDRTWIGVVEFKRQSSTVTPIGSVAPGSSGDATGLTITITGSSSNLRININNATGEEVDGRIFVDWDRAELIA